MNIKLIDSIMVTLRQDRPCKEGLRRILPQRIEDGKMYSALDIFITSVPNDVEDQEFFEKEEVMEATRVTDPLLTRLYKPITEFLYEYKKAGIDDEVEDGPKPTPSEAEDDMGEEEDETIVGDIQKLIAAGKIKKAKKLIKLHEGDLGKKMVKKLKKEIKNG